MHRQMKQFNKFCVSFPINKDASIALSKMQNVMVMCSNGYTPEQLKRFYNSFLKITVDTLKNIKAINDSCYEVEQDNQ